MNKAVFELQKSLVLKLKKNKIRSAEIDTQIILEFVAKKSREFLLANPDYRVSNREVEKIKKITELRCKHLPISYIVGKKEFFSLDFAVSPDVLIPRPETEQLVEEALNFLKSKNRKPKTILDVGTGSGNIIISIAKNINYQSSKNNFFASDVSQKALGVARKNSKKYQTKINFIQSDLFENIKGKFDLITANLPYVPRNGSDDKEIKYEPQNAIFSDKNGTATIIKFLEESKNYISSDGMILIEADPRNIESIKKYALKNYKTVNALTDLSGKFRVLSILPN
jgi:release factor glutamine methyltransferase